MIKFESVSKTFYHNKKPIPALSDINLDVGRGEIFGVVGESGAGKSTLIRCANLLERPTSGRVLLDNKELTALSKRELLEARHNIGMIFQHFNLLLSKTIYENVALPLYLTKKPSHFIRSRVDELLDLVGLSDKKHHYPSQLSGGQKQRVAIARALATNPSVLLSDEATSALDPETTDSILALLKEINHKFSLTILLITHEMHVVKKICDSVALIQSGQLVEKQDVDSFFISPKSDLGKAFVNRSHQFELPSIIAKDLQLELTENKYHPIIKLTFHGGNVNDPIISSLTRQFDINVNIIQAKVETIKNETLGLLIAELEGEQAQNKKALDYLSSLPLEMEVLGYV